MAQITAKRTKQQNDAAGFDKIARNIFAPIYPVIARQILERTGVRGGICLDLGAGTGRLGYAIAELAPLLDVILYDKSKEMLSIAGKDNSYLDRVKLLRGKAEEIPLSDETIDLAVSRGSLFFWDDQKKGIEQIYRVLRPGGWAVIGGGFGTKELFKEVDAVMAEEYPDWSERRKERIGAMGKAHFERVMKESLVPNYKVEQGEKGLWIIFQK
jgi:ubiquinone/menaquinone biosynthesis C-methylase UbiE